MKSRTLLFLLLLSTHGYTQSYQTNIPVHDPVMIKQDSVYYLFCTGRGISMWSSKDMTNWKQEKPVFDTLPWAGKTVKGFRNHIWAPDISYHNGLYYLFRFCFWKKHILYWCSNKQDPASGQCRV